MSNNFFEIHKQQQLGDRPDPSTDCILNLLLLSSGNAGRVGNAGVGLNNDIGNICNNSTGTGVNSTMSANSAYFNMPDKKQLNTQPIIATGRPITNTSNLGGKPSSGHLLRQTSSNLTSKDIGHRLNLLRSYSEQFADSNDSTPIIMNNQNKTHRNGDGPFNSNNDFGDFIAPREGYGSMQTSSHANNRNLNPLNNFPIGTFSLESINQTPNVFNAAVSDTPNGFTNMMNSNGGNIFHAQNIPNMMNGGPPFNANNNGGDASQASRETGIIEKLLHSYGFIQCCERQARLFFHFSQFSGNIEHLKIGDPVEFEMTYDRRTGKPIASLVTKIAPEVVLSEERVTGNVTTELKSSENMNAGETTGRISYENRGECFFLPYTKDDVEGNVTLRAGDKVSFQIATNQRGNLGACHIRLENPVHPVKYRGVVCSMKESFGFIERADIVKEIFFHFSEAEGTVELRPGDDVEFIIQTRNGKEVACNITRLPPGSVIFEDVGTVIYKGQVLKPLDRNSATVRHNTDPLPGRIRYRAPDHSEVEVPFGDKDQKGDYTLRHGDWVQFYLATDRRDQLQRATNIALLDETFEVSGERREQGAVAALKEGFGFLRCVDRNVRIFFHFTEVLDTTRDICVGDEVEFTVIQEPGSSLNPRLCAIRIKHLPPGQVQFETLVESSVEGVITREAPKSPLKTTDRMEGGVISYPLHSAHKKTIMFFLKDCEHTPHVGDQVRFDICEVKRNKELIAANIVEIGSGNTFNPNTSVSETNTARDNQRSNSNDKSEMYQGFIAVLKDNFGFIETTKHDEEVFFHFSNFSSGNPNNLELGQEVEYTLSTRSTGNPNNSASGNCLPAENVKILAKGTIIQPRVLDKIYNGTVIRPLRCINPEQSEYSGLIERSKSNDDIDDSKLETYEFGITSLTNKRDLLQKGDAVEFRVDEAGRAAEIISIRQKKRAYVDSIKGQFGFLDYEIEEGKKLFFHMSEVQGNSNNLYTGDSVEFCVVTNQRTGKSSACNVVKIDNSVRPERLLSRIKLKSIDDNVPRLIAVRQPKGPSGKGFQTTARIPHLPGVLIESV